MRIKNIIVASLISLVMVSCQKENEAPVNTYGNINVGGFGYGTSIKTNVSKADDPNNPEEEEVLPVDAETLEWFLPILKSGLEIKYSNKFSVSTITSNKVIATLQYDDVNSRYTFTDKATGAAAQWLGNGNHLFIGNYIPAELKRTDVAEYLKNQGDADSYTNLNRYTSMKPATTIAATVNLIKFPFQHRLARVITQVIIDPILLEDYSSGNKVATIKGYDNTLTDAGGANCLIRFCDVDLLDHVVETVTSTETISTPKWKVIDRVIPHYLGEKDGVKYTHKEAEGEKTYDKVPCFDVIVRPTYLGEAVMDDEENTVTGDEVNSIHYVVELTNGMVYEKDVTFDLNPNEQTTITLFITKEGVDYNDSGTTNWVPVKFTDYYYGIDNENENRLSLAGSSWQRAYRIGTADYNHVTDGSLPNDTQFISEETFIEYLKEAKIGGTKHGAYFILDNDLSLTGWTPFEFTGHLDCRENKISYDSECLFTGLKGDYDASGDGKDNVHDDNSPLKGFRAEILNLKVEKDLIGGDCTGFLYNCTTLPGKKFYETLTPPGTAVECREVN